MGSNHHINYNKFRERLLSNSLTNEEKDLLRDDINSSFKNSELENLLREHWDQEESIPVAEQDLYFRNLRLQIWRKINKAEEKTGILNTRSTLKFTLIRIAAIMFLPLVLTTAYFSYLVFQNKADQPVSMQQVFASPGSRVHFMLPDSSEVWLNSGSTLEYPVQMASLSSRDVKLSGQGYFHVKRDTGHPFIVKTSELNIKVLGTMFDVSDYPNEPTFSTTLEHGSIALLNAKGKEVTRLQPGQRAVLDRASNELSVDNVNTNYTTSWKDGRLVFKEAQLAEVVRQLERWYNCRITVAPELLNADIRYTATIENETLGEVLAMLEISTSLKTKQNGRDVRIMR